MNEPIQTALGEIRDVRIAAARIGQFAGALLATRSQPIAPLGCGRDADSMTPRFLGLASASTPAQ